MKKLFLLSMLGSIAIQSLSMNITKRQRLEETDNLFEAIIRNDINAAKAALADGASLDEREICLKTPLTHAVSYNNPMMVEFLLNTKANTAVTDSYGKTALTMSLSPEVAQIFRPRIEQLIIATSINELQPVSKIIADYCL